MALLALIGVLRGFPVAAYRRTPHRKPLCGLDQDKNCSFMDGHWFASTQRTKGFETAYHYFLEFSCQGNNFKYPV